MQLIFKIWRSQKRWGLQVEMWDPPMYTSYLKPWNWMRSLRSESEDREEVQALCSWVQEKKDGSAEETEKSNKWCRRFQDSNFQFWGGCSRSWKASEAAGEKNKSLQKSCVQSLWRAVEAIKLKKKKKITRMQGVKKIWPAIKRECK